MSPKVRRDGFARGSARVGMLVLTALAVLLAAILMIGQQHHLFRPMNEYTIRFANVQGLQAGSPVQLAGVAVGRVADVVLPEDPKADELVVHLRVDQRYGGRIRRDSVGKIQTLGLLGDKFVSLTAGSADAVVIENGGEIDAAPASDVDRILASGESAVENIVAISSDLVKLLNRVEQGDSLLGLLMAPLPEGSRTASDFFATIDGLLNAIDRVSLAVEEGESPVARFLVDKEMGAHMAQSMSRLDSALTRLDEVLVEVQSGDGLAPALLSDAEMKERFEATLTSLQSTSERLDRLVAEVESGDGLVPKLLYDEAFAERTGERVDRVLERLDQLSLSLVEGDGTVPLLLRDPRIYEAINDVIVGVEDSRLLRWLIRNRQRAGIEARYEAAQESTEPSDAPRSDPPSQRP